MVSGHPDKFNTHSEPLLSPLRLLHARQVAYHVLAMVQDGRAGTVVRAPVG